MKYWPTKTVAEVKNKGLDWSQTLGKLGDLTIVNSTWTRLQGTATLANTEIQPGGKRTSARVSGGTAGEINIFRNTVTLSDTPATVLDEDVFMRVRA